MGSYDCDPPSVYEDREVTARKAHICGECGHPIVSGEKYHQHAGCTDGQWWHEKECVCCHGKRCALAEYFDLDCIPFGLLAETEAEYDAERAAEASRLEAHARG